MKCQHSLLKFALIILLCLAVCISGYCQDTATPKNDTDNAFSTTPGDRITSITPQSNETALNLISKDIYRLGPGDVLSVNVQGRSAINYHAKPEPGPQDDPTLVTVSPTGNLYLPLVGNIDAAGKTIAEVEDIVQAGLKKYFKHFQLSISLATARSVNIWVGGEVVSTGLQVIPSASNVSYPVLNAKFRPTGSVRRIELLRSGKKQTLDLYRMVILGDMDADILLQAGDSIHVPAISKYVDVSGEVIRQGRYEMVTLDGREENFRVKDLLQLAIGPNPMAALDKAYIERTGPDAKRISISLDLSKDADSKAADTVMQPGDILVVPSISSFQPIIRLIGEFKGEGVYQRLPGTLVTGITDVGRGNMAYNKSGIYYLKQGQTVRDIITTTGGVTPQADLQRAYIKRQVDGAYKQVPVNLEALLVKDDKSADLAIQNGDTLVLPALSDNVHVFGEVKNPGSYVYGPNRRLLDYIGDANGPGRSAKLSDVRIVRGTAESPILLHADANKAIHGKSSDGNPVLEPGDIIFVPSKFISDWRDAVQLVFTSLSLRSLVK